VCITVEYDETDAPALARPSVGHSTRTLIAAAAAGAMLALCACAVASARFSPASAAAVQTGDAATTVSEAVNASVAARATLVPVPLETTRVSLDETFVEPASGWPNDPTGTGWYTASGYQLEARDPGKFVAIDAPSTDAFHDGSLSARFHKRGGPPGGGYGLILADQGPEVHDGMFQGGRFVVVEVGDDGRFGIWQRERDHWIDLVPWTNSSAVHPGVAANDLLVQAQGKRLSFAVNGADVGHVDTELAAGRVGIFVGGDGNQVQLERFSLDWMAATGGSAGATPARRASGL
jgi:hypothetical protein